MEEMDIKQQVEKKHAQATPDEIIQTLEPDEMVEYFSKAPEEVQKQVMRSVSMSLSMSRQSPETSVANKLTSEHITEYFETSKEAMHREYDDRDKSRKHQLWLLAMAGVFLVVFILLLKSNPELLEKLAYAFVGLIGGYGFGRYKREE